MPDAQPAPVPPADSAKKRNKRQDVYIGTVKVSIPIDMTDPKTIADAAAVVAKMKDGLPSGTSVESGARIGKIEAA